MPEEIILTKSQKKFLFEINQLPDELIDNLLEIVKILKKTTNYQFNKEEKPVLLAQYQSLISDWEAPGMEVYDDL